MASLSLFSPTLKMFSLGGISNNDTGPQVGHVGGADTDAGIAVTDERAMRVSAVWDCVQLITNSVCSLPLNFYKKVDEGREQITTLQNPLVALFNNRPNRFMKPRDFRKAMTMQMALWSNAYAFIDYVNDRPVSITPLKPGRTTPFVDDSGKLTYHYTTDNGIVVFDAKSILHLKGFGTDGIVGMERMSYARNTLGLSVSADVYASKQFAHGGRSGGGYLMLDQFLTPEQREQFRKVYEGMSTTAYNKGKFWILEGGLKYQNDMLNPDTLQMIETRKMQIGEIARFFGVPEVLIGGGGATSSWPSSFEQQLLYFLTFTLQDYLDEWESAIKYSLVGSREKNNTFADHDLTGFIKMDSQAKANYLSTLVQNGLETRNEARKFLGLPKSDAPGADDLTVQVNLSPIDKLQSIDTGNAPASIDEGQPRQN